MRKIVLENYNKKWKALYLEEICLIKEFLSGELISNHHIGSTAIPEIKAKPVIDILLEVKSIQKLDDYNSYFENISYEVKGEYGIKGRRFFQKGGDERTHHVHIFEKGNPEIIRHIRFRDYMINNKQKALEYEKLKVELCQKYLNDPESYSNGKSEFIRLIEKEITRN